ncbi:hypothetical protein [Kitasatospora sp. LaBMicrA B282]|uniref:hypothetical protein n=1 Tax=Kitasatospora sp. LaBMicrA B282 TaxID=3420949 RepID=UPI003D14192B
MTGDRLLRVALRAYPKRYRAERAAEIGEVFADVTAQAGRVAVARELAELTGYGLRLRLGLTATRPAGRLLGESAPLLVAAAAGTGVAQFGERLRWHDWYFFAGDQRLQLALGGLAVLTLGAVLLGWWAVARAGALLTVVGWAMNLVIMVGEQYPFRHGGHWQLMLAFAVIILVLQCGPLLWALMVLAAPVDLLDRGVRRRRPAPVLALLLVTAVAGYAPCTLTLRSASLQLPGCTVYAGLFLTVLAAGALRRVQVPPAGVALAWLPMMVPLLSAPLDSFHLVGSIAMVLSAVALVGTLTVRRWRALAGGRGGRDRTPLGSVGPV